MSFHSSDETPSSLVHLPKVDGEAGPARWLSPEDTAALVTATLHTHALRKQQRRSHMMQLAAGLALFFGLSAAVSAAWLLRVRKDGPQAQKIAPPAVAAALEVETPTPAEAPAPQLEPVVKVAPARRAPRPASAADLLANANQLRRQARWGEAASAYERAVQSAPRSQDAYAAMVAAGGLYVEKLRKPQRGAKLFAHALAAQPAGALSEEARWGLAQAYKAMRNKSAERKALHRFLAHHPHGALSSQVKTRLLQLEH